MSDDVATSFETLSSDETAAIMPEPMNKIPPSLAIRAAVPGYSVVMAGSTARIPPEWAGTPIYPIAKIAFLAGSSGDGFSVREAAEFLLGRSRMTIEIVRSVK